MSGYTRDTGFLLGLDAIRDYNIDLTPSRMVGNIDGLSFPLYAHTTPRFQHVKVFAMKRIVVPGRTTVPIAINAACLDGIDYVFTPHVLAELSIPATPQMARGIVDANTRFILFSNHSEHPVRIDKRQVLGEAEAIPFGSVESATHHVIHCDDLIQPHSRIPPSASIGLKPPQTVAMEELFGKDVDDITCFQMTSATAHCDPIAFEDQLKFDAFGREMPRRRTLPDTTIKRMALTAQKRMPGDSFPENRHENEDVAFPTIPTDAYRCQ
jgi:hypothetical protein